MTVHALNPFALWLSTYAAGAVAERPWWIGAFGSGPTWARTDGAQVTKRMKSRSRTRAEMLTAVDAIDDERPLPIPPPMGTQVWAWPNGEQHVVGKVWGAGGGVTFSNGDTLPPGMWPPHNAVLVGGPRAPWAPKGWRP